MASLAFKDLPPEIKDIVRNVLEHRAGVRYVTKGAKLPISISTAPILFFGLERADSFQGITRLAFALGSALPFFGLGGGLGYILYRGHDSRFTKEYQILFRALRNTSDPKIRSLLGTKMQTT
jgi:hypothetical protein